MTIRAENDITLARVDDGSDGFSPIANVTKTGDTATITITDKNGTTQETVSDGTSGVSITDVKTQYYLSTSEASAQDGAWEDEPQEFVHGKFYWTRDFITYSDSTTSTSTPVYNQGLTLANEYALSANEAAQSATNFAVYARQQLGVVEDIVGVLDLISKNGQYELSTDREAIPDNRYYIRTGSGTTADPYVYKLAPDQYNYFLTSDVAIDDDKTYYTRSGAGTEADPYVYTPVELPDVADIGTYYEKESPVSLGYYELVSIDESIQNYVSSHLVLDSQGLNVMNGKTRLLLSTADGLVLFDQGGTKIAQYGSETFIGNGDYKVELTPTAMVFKESNTPVASVSQQELVINNTRVNRSMRMGNFVWTINTDGRLILKYSEE